MLGLIEGILECLRCLSDLGSCWNGDGPRWYGRTRPIRIAMIVNKVLRRLCILLGIAGIVLLDPEAPRTGAVMIGAAVAIPVLTLAWEFWLTGRGLIVPGPSRWPPGPRR